MAGVVLPGLETFLSSIKSSPVENSIEQLTSLLRRRQICGSRSSAIATAHLLRKAVGAFRTAGVAKLIERVQSVGAQLEAAQPRELAVGNVVRRVLRVVRDEAEENREGHTNAQSQLRTINSDKASWPPSSPFTSAVSDGHTEENVLTSHPPSVVGAGIPTTASLFGPISHSSSRGVSPLGTKGNSSSRSDIPGMTATSTQDFKAEVIEGIQELIDELKQAEDQIAGYALDHIHTNEVILAHSLSATVQRFLLKVAAKRAFSVMCADTSSGTHGNNRALHNRHLTKPDSQGDTLRFQRNLAAAGVNVILIPNSAVYAVMSRVNKVVLDSHVMLSDGSLVAAAGAKAVAQAAHMHRAPVIVLGGIYQISPVNVFDTEKLIDYGDPADIIPFGQRDILEKISVRSPLYDHISAKSVDLYITNL
ncbi:MAG: hypothetical protein Q9183_000443, partial [Haloplaca sp. 2 TL-2023]